MKTLNDLLLGEELIGHSGEAIINSSLTAQRVEDREIATDGCLWAWAQHMAYEEIVQLLAQSLEEGKDAQFKLTHLAESLSILEGAQPTSSQLSF